jgi:hypothetical protein
MADPRPSITSEHRELLRHFVRLVDEMRRCQFIETYNKQDHTISFAPTDGGEPAITAPEYDWEGFVAFLTIFRQLAISKKEQVYLFRISTVVSRYASPNLQEQLAAMEAALKPLLEGKHQGLRFGREPSPDQDAISLTSFEILDAIVNGRVFHADKKHRPAVAFLDASERWQFLWPVMVEIVIPGLKGCIWLFHALRSDGILQDDDYPARCKEAVVVSLGEKTP